MFRRQLIFVMLLTACGLAIADQVTLTTGETLQGKLTEQTDTVVTLEHPILGTLSIPAEHVSAVVEDQPPMKAADMVETEPAPSQSIETPQSSFHQDWDSRLELGLNGSEGNAETTNFRIAFSTARKTDSTRSKFASSFDHTTSDGQTTRNDINVQFTHDWLMPGSPWLIFVKGIYDFDQFRAWDHRVSGFTGLGYEFVKSERLEIVARLGGGLTKEFGGEDELRPEGIISGSVLKWKMTDNQTLAGSLTYYPDLAEFPDNRVVSALEWLIQLDKANELHLKIGVESEYESVTAGDIKHNDMKYYGSLVIEF